MRAVNPAFGRLMLMNHCPSILVAFVDVLVVKDRTLLAEFTPAVPSLVIAAFGYTLGYLALIELTQRSNGGYWPYPFMDELFKNILAKVIFVVLVRSHPISNVLLPTPPPPMKVVIVFRLAQVTAVTLAITVGFWALAVKLKLPSF